MILTLYLALPVTPWSTYVLAAVLGLTWLGTVPLTNALVADIFGVRYVSTLFGIAFFGHQVGSFFGAWYGGYARHQRFVHAGLDPVHCLERACGALVLPDRRSASRRERLRTGGKIRVS